MEKTIKKWLKALKANESTISMLLGIAVVFIVGLLIFNYFKQAGKKEISEEGAIEEATTSAELLKELEEAEGEKAVTPEGLPTKHKVEKGEYLWKIAEKYYGSGYNWVDIAKENKLTNPNLLFTDQELNIPKVEVRKPKMAIAAVVAPQPITGNSYKVQKGDNLWLIAVRAYQDGYKWPEIAKANNLANPHYIEVDQELKLLR